MASVMNRYYIPFSRSQSFPESSKKALISCLSDATNKVLYKIFVPDVIDGLECIELGFEKATREGRRTDTDARSSTECGMCGETLLSEDPNLLWWDAKKKVMSVWVLFQAKYTWSEWMDAEANEKKTDAERNELNNIRD